MMMMMMMMMMWLRRQVKLSREQAAEPATLPSDAHDTQNVADDDAAKQNRRSSTEAPVPPVSCVSQLFYLLQPTNQQFIFRN